jgi:peptide/nickel transport system substrate-binding protein
LTRQAGIVQRFIVVATLVGIGAAAACQANRGTDSSSTRAAAGKSVAARGGEIVASVRTDPASFNRLIKADRTTDLFTVLTQGKLVRINKVTQAVEPWLAESWTMDPDGRRFTLKLRSDAAFSDGQPFTADDVVFSFRAVYDKKTDSVLADSMMVGDKPLEVAAVDAHTVSITFPSTFGPGVRILDNLPILPKHKLEAALAAGTLATTWGTATPVSDLAGLGPFVLRAYTPGQRLVFERNPHYWRKAPDGTQLPYLDRITVELIPDQNAEMLRLEGGQLDVMNEEMTAEAYAPLRKAASEGRVQLIDVGPATQADSFWFNLKPGAFGSDQKASWLQRDELRHAISMAVDRKTFADTVFLGAADPVYGPVSPAVKAWYWSGTPQIPHDPNAAKALLAKIGLIDRNGDGLLDDPAGQPARFSILVQKGRPRHERGAAVIRDELKKIGLSVDVVALEGNTVVERIIRGNYEAVFFAPTISDIDPAVSPDFWLSSGPFHLWNPLQKKPATEWERQMDDLFLRQTASTDQAERKRLFDDMQRIFVEHEPVIYFVARRIFVAVSSRITAMTPAADIIPVLWAPDQIAVSH